MKIFTISTLLIFILFSTITRAVAVDWGSVGSGLRQGLGDREEISNEDKLLNSIDFPKKGYVSKKEREAKTLAIWQKVKKEANFVELDRVKNIPNPSLTIVSYINMDSPIKGEDGYLELWEIGNHIYDDQSDHATKSTASRYLVFCEQGLLLKAAYLSFSQQMAEGNPTFMYNHGVSIVGDKAKAFKIYKRVCGVE